MALIKCKECGKEISDKAKVCIHCGFPIEEEIKNDVKIETKHEQKDICEYSDEELLHEANRCRINKDFNKALEFYFVLANKRNGNAAYWVGVFYERGYSVQKDLKIAVDWYQKSSDLGYSKGSSSLATMHQNGIGVKQDEEIAIQFYELAIQQDKNNSTALNNLAVIYINRNDEQKYTEAAELLRRAIKLGNKNSPRNYDILLQRINTQPKNIAKVWIKVLGMFGSLALGVACIVKAEDPFGGLIGMAVFAGLAVLIGKIESEEEKDFHAKNLKEIHEEKITNGYLCPNCKCNAGYPLNTAGKVISVGTLGLASGKIGKTYKCHNCGYMW